jgi:hypothetical protein
MFDINYDDMSFDPGSVTAPAMPGIAPANYSMELTAGGGGYAAAATLLASQQSKRLLNANAGIAELQARSEAQAGGEQAELYRQHLDATMGKQEAAVGGSNVTMTGSPLRALASTAQLGAQDIARIQTNASRKAWGYDVTAAGDRVRSQQAGAAGVANTIGSLITTGARAYGQWSTD